MLLCCLICHRAAAQSLSGNLNSAADRSVLGYGNVDIYQNDKLVASVLTDHAGNFNVKLDTGRYICVANYAGFETVTKEIHVLSDERTEFTAKEDPTRPKREKKAPTSSSMSLGAEMKAIETTTFHIGSEVAKPVSYTFSHDLDTEGGTYTHGTDDLGYADYFAEGKPNLGGTKGALTAGEINDFSKWKLWQDISATDLGKFQGVWNIAPKGRYTIELHSKTGLPIADALVKLKQRGGSTIYSARTDNTGKAELWLTIKNENPAIPGGLTMEVVHKGKTSQINDVQPFEKSLNHLVLDVTCDQNENVDIAFVVDATGSMGDELSYLQAEMNDIIFQSKQISSKLNFRFANVFYRDNGANELYLTRKMDFNRILSESVNYISDQSAGGGGDFPEAVDVALDSAINGLSWSEDARARILFLILDAPPHNTPEIQAKLQKLIGQAAEKGIRIVPIGASGIDKSTEYLMRCMALGTNGTYTFLTDHSGIGNKHIEPTTDKYDVELLNEVMVRILKSYTYMPDCDQQLPDLVLNYPDSIVAYPEPQPQDSLDTLASNPADSIPDSRDSLDQQVVNVKWSYWPNPTNGIVNITADVDITELYITDLSGKVLQLLENVEKDRTVQVDLGAYATGIYLIRYPMGKTWVTGKVVLQR